MRDSRDFPDSEFADHITIAIDVIPPQVVQQTASLADNLQKPPAGAVIFFVRLEVFGEVGNALAKDGNLDFGRPRIRGVDTVLRNDGSFGFFR